MYYGIADKFLFDNAHKDAICIRNNGLIGSRFNSMSDLIASVGAENKRTVKRAMKTYANADPISKTYISSADFLKNQFSDKYVIQYEIKDNGYIEIIKKTQITNEDLEKYMILCS